jgi:hypothetical protein
LFSSEIENLLRNPEFDPVENVFIWLAREKRKASLSPLAIAGSIHALVK